MKALVVEPSKMYQSLFNEFLNGFSISHEMVTAAKEALAELAKEPVDVVIIAMNLADSIATELASQIKSQSEHADTTIIVMTGEQQVEKLQQMKTAEVDHICQRHQLFDLADQAAYQAKAQGGNRVCSLGDFSESIAL